MLCAGELFFAELSSICSGDIREQNCSIGGMTNLSTGQMISRLIKAMSIDGAALAASLGAVPLTESDLCSMSWLQRHRLSMAALRVLRRLNSDISGEARRVQMITNKGGEIKWR